MKKLKKVGERKTEFDLNKINNLLSKLNKEDKIFLKSYLVWVINNTRRPSDKSKDPIESRLCNLFRNKFSKSKEYRWVSEKLSELLNRTLNNIRVKEAYRLFLENEYLPRCRELGRRPTDPHNEKERRLEHKYRSVVTEFPDLITGEIEEEIIKFSKSKKRSNSISKEKIINNFMENEYLPWCREHKKRPSMSCDKSTNEGRVERTLANRYAEYHSKNYNIIENYENKLKLVGRVVGSSMGHFKKYITFCLENKRKPSCLKKEERNLYTWWYNNSRKTSTKEFIENFDILFIASEKYKDPVAIETIDLIKNHLEKEGT